LQAMRDTPSMAVGLLMNSSAANGRGEEPRQTVRRGNAKWPATAWPNGATPLPWALEKVDSCGSHASCVLYTIREGQREISNHPAG
jgi:hypothetical protein